MELDYSRGILQAIGFKEFKDYLHASVQIDKENKSPERLKDIETLKLQGIEKMKQKTRQYAKRQMTWIRNKFLPRTDGNYVQCLQLNANESDLWKTEVYEKALISAKAFLDF